MHRDLCRGAIDLTEIVGREFNLGCPDVLCQPVQLRGARDGNNPRLLRQQLGECDLCGRRVLLFCHLAEEIHHDLICFAILRHKARRLSPKS